MALATPVTTSSISRLSGSKRRPKSTCRSPTVSQVTDEFTAAAPSRSAPMKTMLRRNPATTAPMERPALSLRSCCVNSVMTAAASSGRNRMIQGKSSGRIS